MKKERFYMTVLQIIVCFRSRERERESHLREGDEDGAFNRNQFRTKMKNI